MEEISRKISAKIKIELNLDENKEEVIAYGIFALIQIILSIFFTVFFGFIFHVLIESLIIMFVVIFLRKYSGGVHAKSPKLCITFGTIVTVSLGLFSKNLSLVKFNIFYITIILSLTFIIAFYITYRKAPVDSKNKRIINKNKKKRMKFGALKVLFIYLILAILSTGAKNILNIDNYYILFSICLGVLWQTFTLTESCAFFIKKIESII